MDFSGQLARISEKLHLANAHDPDRKVFGADSHDYGFDPPATDQDVRAFEDEFDVELPEDYVAFIKTMGNGGPGAYGDCGAGPSYGIYPLGEFGYMQIDRGSMSAPCTFTSKISENAWEDLTEFERDENLDQDSIEYDMRYRELFNGLMSIGTQGCNFQMMLVLNGDDKGRVVYIDQDLQIPKFPPERNFLDWYEAWLDRILKDEPE